MRLSSALQSPIQFQTASMMRAKLIIVTMPRCQRNYCCTLITNQESLFPMKTTSFFKLHKAVNAFSLPYAPLERSESHAGNRDIYW